MLEYGRSNNHIGPHRSFTVHRIGPQIWQRHSEKIQEGK